MNIDLQGMSVLVLAERAAKARLGQPTDCAFVGA